MEKNKLEKYIKRKPETVPRVNTTISIDEKQLKFIQGKNLNLSKLVRDFLSRLMKGKKDTDLL